MQATCRMQKERQMQQKQKEQGKKTTKKAEMFTMEL